MQIGLGTFGTLVQNLAGGSKEWNAAMAWLLGATSEQRPEHFRGVAVEPVKDHVDRLQRVVDRLPFVELVQAAIGEENAEGQELYVLTDQASEDLLREVPTALRSRLERELTYVKNMSCVGGMNKSLERCRRDVWQKYRLDLRLAPKRTDVWTYGRLARRLGFCGCEVLVVDAEGHDAKILRSMIRHCREHEASGKTAWPDVIVFESAGHCDEKEGFQAESAILRQLEDCGYKAFLIDKMNTHMIHLEAFQRSKRLKLWMGQTYCYRCNSKGPWPFIISECGIVCERCAGLSEP